MDGYAVMVKRVYRAGLSTHPWGKPVFKVIVEDVRSPTLTFCGLFETKSRIHEQSEVGRPR